MNQVVSRRRRPSWRSFAVPGGVLLGLLVLSTCTPPPPPIIVPKPKPPATTRPTTTTRPATTTTPTTTTVPSEPDCTVELTPAEVVAAVASAQPGDVLCVSAGDLGSAR